VWSLKEISYGVRCSEPWNVRPQCEIRPTLALSYYLMAPYSILVHDYTFPPNQAPAIFQLCTIVINNIPCRSSRPWKVSWSGDLFITWRCCHVYVVDVVKGRYGAWIYNSRSNMSHNGSLQCKHHLSSVSQHLIMLRIAGLMQGDTHLNHRLP